MKREEIFMVAVEFNSLYYNLVVLLSSLAPGIAIGVPILRKSELSILEKLAICFFIGLISVPLLLFAESLVGVGFSLPLVLANILILVAAGVFYGIREKAFSFQLPKISLDADKVLSEEFVKKHAVTFLLLLALFLSYQIRMAPLSPIYSELDPYWYVYGSGQIIREGMIPLGDDTAWWPEQVSNHRSVPLRAYTDAEWYSLYTGGGGYNNYLLFLTSSWLPPITSAIAAFGAYLLFSAIYGRRYGIFAAFAMAFLPIGIFKMSAGVNEAISYGVLGLLLMAGAYAMALKKKDPVLAGIAGVAAAVVTLGSNYESVLIIAFAGYVALQTLDYYWRGKKNELFVKMNMLIGAGIVIGGFLELFYGFGSPITALLHLLTGNEILAVAAVALSFVAERALEQGWSDKKRQKYLAALAVAGVLLLAFTPLGFAVASKIGSFVGYAAFNQPLDRTIAEQNKAGGTFESEAGFLALVPANHVVSAPKDALEAAGSIGYQFLGILTGIITPIGNVALSAADAAFNFILGRNDIATGEKASSLLMFFLVIATAGLVWRHFSRKGEERDVPSVMLLILLFMLPATYVGLNKIKFVIFVGMASVIVAVAGMAEIELLALWIARKMKQVEWEKYVRIAFIVLLFGFAYAQAAGPMPYAKLFVAKSFEMRYQDDPAASMQKFASFCEQLKQKGYTDQMICAAGSDIHVADTINGQFNSNLCVLSQLSFEELLPASDAASQQRAGEARSSAGFRCGRLNEYWIDSMEWIRNNVPAEDRIISWWDYGHWINFFGDRKTVLRNEHLSKGMIGRVAHDYLDGTTQELTATMNYYDSRYALFDQELLGGVGGSAFGNKYGALNYLSCAHNGETSTSESPGGSQCEFDHMPERLAVPKQLSPGLECTISDSQQLKGVLAFTITSRGIDPSKPSYCIGEATLSTGEKVSATYYLDRKDPNGDLVLSKGFMRKIGEEQDASIVEMVYNKQKAWPGPDGTWVDGMEDAKGKFYSSNLYRGMFLDELDGFDLVYASKNSEVKIYRMRNFVGNKERYIDPVAVTKAQ